MTETINDVCAGFNLRFTLREPKIKNSLRQFFTELKWSPDGRYLVSGTRDHNIRVWEASTGELNKTISFDFKQLAGIAGRTVAYSPDGQYIAFGGLGGIVYIWDSETGDLHTKLDGHEGSICSIAWSPDSSKLASCSTANEAYIWDIDSGLYNTIYKSVPDDQVLTLAWSSVNDILITGHDTGEIAFLYDASKKPDDRVMILPRTAQAFRTYERIYTAPGARRGRLYNPVKCAAWSPDGKMIAWGGDDSAIEVHIDEKMESRITLQGHTYPVTSVSFSFNNEFLASKSLDGTIRIWECHTWNTVAILDEPVHNFTSFATIAFHPTLPILATLGDEDSIVRIWDIGLDKIRQKGKNEDSVTSAIAVVDNVDQLPNQQVLDADYNKLIASLESINAGSEQAHDYHNLILDIIAILFDPELRNPQKEQKLHDGRKRVDIVCDNRASSGFFQDLTIRHGIRCPYIFFECKNYSSDPKNKELDQLAGRFSTRRGNFGVLVCRTIEDRGKMIQRSRDMLNDNRGFAIALDDSDIKNLLQLKANGNSEGIDVYMQNLLRKIII